MSPRCSIIVVNYGACDLVSRFLKSVENVDHDFVGEVIIVDNGYPQKGDSRKVIDPRQFPFPILFVQNPGASYASGVNRGAGLATCDYFVISNNDIELLPDRSLKSLLPCLERDPLIGVMGPQLVYPDGNWQRSYGWFPSLREAIVSLTMLDSICHGIARFAFRHSWLPKRPKKVDYIDGAFMVVRRSCFEELGGFNEGYSFYGEDADFCWRAQRAGWKVIFFPNIRVIHVRGASSTANALEEFTIRLFKAKQRFVKDHYGALQAKWYRRLAKAALYERKVLYGLFARLIRSPYWKQRAYEAKVRYQAVERIDSQEKGYESCSY